MLEISISAVLLGLLLTLLITPFVKKLACKCNIVDSPNERKIHKHPTPRLGGLAIFLSITIVSVLYFFLAADYIPDNHSSTQVFISIFIGAALMLMLGLYDDTKRMRASTKLIMQINIAALVFILGFRIEFIRLFDGIYFNLGVFSFPFTVLWIVGITNAVNLIDGMDGLASGLSLVAFAFIGIIAILFGNYHVAVISFAFCGALIGFMRYNFHPASIFMGDSGSLFLGYVLAIFSVQAMRNGHLQFSILISCFILAVPILDTSLAIARRFFKYYLNNGNGKSIVNTIKKIIYPDKAHIHHKFLEKGLSQRAVSLRLYGISLMGGLIAIAFNYMDDNMIILLLTSTSLAILKFIDYLNYEDFAYERRFTYLSQSKIK